MGPHETDPCQEATTTWIRRGRIPEEKTPGHEATKTISYNGNSSSPRAVVPGPPVACGHDTSGQSGGFCLRPTYGGTTFSPLRGKDVKIVKHTSVSVRRPEGFNGFIEYGACPLCGLTRGPPGPGGRNEAATWAGSVVALLLA
ncbi:hypothetical protein EVAR_37857_1 [Eumeta japonica]|uniref:Uncharacterized protein n=1 Tax=Eumeta variegata TaxID=151549 RepID=A0A4C1X084_EUMVA|nr:hypothetical protein EVAR_37857_1 [Eumeta japonica]